MKFYHGSPKKFNVLEPQQAKGIDKFQNKRAIFFSKDFDMAALYALGKSLKGKTNFSLPPGKLIIVGKFDLPKKGYVYEIELDGRKVKKKKGSDYEFAWEKPIKKFKTFEVELKNYKDKIFYVKTKEEMIKELEKIRKLNDLNN